MKYSLTTQHMELSDLDRQQLEEKLNRLEKLLTPPYTVDVVFEHSTHHANGEVVQCIINIESGKKVYHAQRDARTAQDAVDEVLNALRQEVTKARAKNRKRSWHIKNIFKPSRR